VPPAIATRTRGGSLLLLFSVSVFGLTGCSAATRPMTTSAPRVLGQERGTPEVVGQPAPAGTGELGAVSCADADHCWAVGVPGPNASTTTTTANPGARVTVIVATDDGGFTWTGQSVSLTPTPVLSGISCPSPADCMAVGSTGDIPGTGIVLVTSDGGTSWKQASVPTGAFVLTSVQCLSVTDCTAITSDGTNFWSAQTVDFGQTWVRDGNLPSGFEDARDLSCTAPAGVNVATNCLVAGYSPTSTGHGQGAIMLSGDGGEDWAAATVPSGLGVLQSVTCVNTSECLAVGTTSTTVSDVVPAKGELLLSTDGGQTWAPAPVDPPVNDIFGVDCPEPLVCAMVGTQWVGNSGIGTGAVAQSRDGGLSFAESTTAYVPLTLTALSCPTPVGCIAVGGDTVARISLPTLTPTGRATRRGPPR